MFSSSNSKNLQDTDKSKEADVNIPLLDSSETDLNAAEDNLQFVENSYQTNQLQNQRNKLHQK